MAIVTKNLDFVLKMIFGSKFITMEPMDLFYHIFLMVPGVWSASRTGCPGGSFQGTRGQYRINLHCVHRLLQLNPGHILMWNKKR